MTTLVRVLIGSLLVLTSLFMILLVLVQRGRGGGLAGALGGMGGQSAFGTKAGDLFTRITVGVAAFWIVLCLVATNLLGRQQSLISSDLGGGAAQTATPMTPAASQTAPAAQPAAQPGATPPTVPAAAAEAAPQTTPAAATVSPAADAPAPPPAPAAAQ